MSNNKDRVGVLIHGCNLNAENWRNISWGTVPGEMGRIPQGLLAGLAFDAEVVVMGSGASYKCFDYPDSPSAGKVLLESEYAKAYLDMRRNDLMGFKAWADYFGSFDDTKWETIIQRLLNRIHLDAQSSNTADELKWAGAKFLEFRCNRVILVSSPTHIIRVLRDALRIYQSNRRFELFSDGLMALPSATSYEGFSAADVVVVEPPHRPDRPMLPTHRRIARMMSLNNLANDSLSEFMQEFDSLLQRYEDLLNHPELCDGTA